MRVNIKAALLSAFVLPGLGQLYKGNRLKGVIIILLVNIFLLAALFIVMQGLGPIILAGKVSGTVDTAKALAHIQSKAPGARWLLAGFLALWLYGLIDAAVGRGGEESPQDKC